MRTNRLLLSAILLSLGVWGAAQFVNFGCGCAYRPDAALKGYHRYVCLWLGPAGVQVEREVTSNDNWVYKDFKQRWVWVSRAMVYRERRPLGPGIDFDQDWRFRMVFVPYWLLALPPAVLLTWRWWTRWRRPRKTAGRGFEVVAARG